MHFFIDHTKLSAQSGSNLKFGPSPSDLEGTFNLTTQFTQSESAKAFACQDGMMVIQRNDADPNNLVNLIIKPSKPTAVGVAVRYYIYKGVKFTSFFTGTPDSAFITPDGDNKSEFIRKFWKDRAKLNFMLFVPGPTPSNFGYGHNDLPLSNPENLNENRPIRDIFNGKAPVKPYPVEKGMWIGDFTDSTIGFEIELETELSLTSTLKSCRVPVIVFLKESLTGLALKRRRELITTFIDPAAFFGMHASVGVDTTTFTGTSRDKSVNRTTPGSLYTAIVEKFTNKNRVYLDVRSERGLSYNFYNNYKIDPEPKNIALHANASYNSIAEINDHAVEYQTHGWPIIFFTDNITHPGSNKNKVDFRLRIDGNIQPVLYFENKMLSSFDKNNLKNFYKDTDIKDSAPQTDWTKKLTLYFSNTGSGSTPANVANYLKVYYFLGTSVTPQSIVGNPRFLNKKYYDSAFCSIDLENLGDTAVKNGHAMNPNAFYIKEPMQLDGTGNFSYAGQSGAYWGTQRIIFYSKSFIKRKNSKDLLQDDGSEKRYLNTYIRRITIGNARFKSELRNEFYVVCKRYSTGGTNFLKILGLNSYHKYENNRQEVVFQEKEDLLLLGLTITEIQALKNTAGLSPSHPRYIFLDPDPEGFLTDTSEQHHRYYRYTVKLQGVDANGTPQVVIPSSAITVYSRDNVFFSSADFAASEALSDGINFDGETRIEFRIYENGSIYINDNIDLALLRKSVLIDEHTVGPDTVVAGDSSSVQQVWYFYYRPGAQPAEICHFNVVMANRMKRAPDGGEIATVPPEFDDIYISYTNGRSKRSFTNSTNVNDGDIITSNKMADTDPNLKLIKYVNQRMKVFMVHFRTAATNADTGPTADNNHNVVFNSSNNNLGIVFSYQETRRHFANPALAAAVLGALIRNNQNLTSTGFSFGDGSCYPSAEHVNGEAMDSLYFSQPPSTWEQDVEFIRALDYYGIKFFRTGLHTTELNNNLSDESFNQSKVKIDTLALEISPGVTLHDTHLHSHDIKLKG